MKNRLLIIVITISFVFTIVSCQKFLNVNSDPDTTQNPSNSSVFPAMLAAIPRGTQYDARYVGKYIQNWLQLANANGDTWDRHGYAISSDAAGDIWRQTYYGLGKNLDYIIDNGRQKGQEDYMGASLALKAYMFQSCTDYHGEIIFNEAFKEGTYYFKYDTQDIVYKGIDSICRLAITYLDIAANKTSTNSLYIGDYVYKGDVAKWKKFVYGILARNYNHLSNKSIYSADSVIKYCDNSFTSVNDDFVIPFDATKNDDSNFFGTYRDNLSNLRQSNFMVKLLDGTTFTGSSTVPNRDPRISHMLSASADTATGNGGYRGVDPGIGDPFSATTSGANFRKRSSVLWADSTIGNPSAAVFTDNGKYLFKNKAVMPVMTYSEIQSIKAEAAFRKNDKATAYTAYINAINAHFDFINRSYSGYRGASNIFNTSAISATARASYLASPNVKANSTTLTITDIMLQKYIAGWCWNWVETWVDLRRFHYTDLDPITGFQVFKGFTLPASYFTDNLNKPAYRVRPRFNSEYVWNLDQLKLFGGDKADYHTYEQWFSKP